MPKNNASIDLCVFDKCNNNCLMCTNPDRPWPAWDGTLDYDFDSIISRLEKFKDKIKSSESLYLSGGEPTIHPHFEKIIKYLNQNFPGNKIKLLTNARVFSYAQTAKKLLTEIPNIEIDASLYGPNEKIHDAVTRARGSFKQTLAGLKNLLSNKQNGQIIGLRTVITKLSYKSIDETLKLIKNEFPTVDRVIVIFPEMEGQAIKNLKNISVTYNEVRPYLLKAAPWLGAFKEIRFYHFPLCGIDKIFWPFVWRTLPGKEVKFLDTCSKCSVKKLCLGIHKEYLKNIGRSDFTPFRDKIKIKKTDNFYRPIGDLAGITQMNIPETPEKIDYPQVYFQIRRFLKNLGFADDQWALGESTDLLFFNYLAKPLKNKNQRVEHYRVWIKRKNNKTRWLNVRESARLETIFPALSARQKKENEQLIKNDIFIIFQDWDGRTVKEMEFTHDNRVFTMQFVLPNIGFNTHEKFFFLNKLTKKTKEKTEHDIVNIKNYFKTENRLIGEVRKKIAQDDTEYANILKKNLRILKKENMEKIGLLEETAQKYKFNTKIQGTPACLTAQKVIRGTIVEEEAVLDWPNKESFILAVNDLEPSLISYLDKVKAVLARRGAVSSHAAAICREFSLPLLVATKNLGLLETGDQVEINFTNGRVKKIKKQ